MLRFYRVVAAVAGRIQTAADGVLDALREGRIRHETDFTSRLLGAIEQALKGQELKGVLWSATVLTSNVRNSEESRFGADFIGVADIHVNGYQVKKGFLAQAKLIRKELNWPLRIRHSEWDRLITQCKKMLEISPSSYVFIYADDGIRIIPAISVVGLEYGWWAWNFEADDPVYSKSVRRFFEEHLKSFIGDPRISAPDVNGLMQLMEKGEVAWLLYLIGRG